jgi:hypothetical protein
MSTRTKDSAHTSQGSHTKRPAEERGWAEGGRKDGSPEEQYQGREQLERQGNSREEEKRQAKTRIRNKGSLGGLEPL